MKRVCMSVKLLFNTILRTLLILLAVVCFQQAFAVDSRYSSSSVLSKGVWKKIKIEKTGIYKITYQELKNMGFSDPMKVSVHGYGGWPLEEDFTKPYVDDLPSISVWRGDGYLLFYGRGCCKWEYSDSDSRFIHKNNPYSIYGCYFLTDATTTREIEKISSLEGNALLQITDFDEYLLHEKDYVSVNMSGRDLYGENISGLTTNISVEGLEGMTEDNGKVVCYFIERATSEKNISLFIDGRQAGCGSVPVITSADRYLDYLKAKVGTVTGQWKGKKNQKIEVQIKSNNPLSSSAYLDYIYLQGKRSLRTYNEPYTFFRSISSIDNSVRYIIQNADSQTLIFDVTDGFNMKLMETQLNDGNLSFSIPSGDLREFVLVQTNKTFPSFSVEDTPNQNLHGLAQTEMVIIVPTDFREDAERLADIHRINDGLSVEVVSPEEIYNEFSSGTPDATAYRRFMKMFYDRSLINGGEAPKYLLLFGDGTYDNRFLTKEWKSYSELDKKNMLLTYQTTESLNAYSYVADDYFGLLDDEEDIFHYEWKKPVSGGLIDIGIGRLTVKTKKQSKDVVDKIISYMTDNKFGFWKNSLCFLADDGSGSDNFSTGHQYDADDVAAIIEKSSPEYIIDKVYFDSYKKNTNGNSYPDVRKEIQRKLNDGLLVLDYVGHGGTEALSDEKVITHNDILKYKYQNLPLWITTTCDFCRFDEIHTSAGEDVLLNEKSGGIALFTTSRVSFTGINKKVNSGLINHLFATTDYRRNSLGDVIKKVKRSMTDGEKLSFCLIGDPALKLSYPKYHIDVTHINGKQLGNSIFQFKAFEKITISGNIINSSGQTVDDFSGELIAQVFDGKSTITTLGNNYGNNVSYDDYINTIYKGNAPVLNGKFSFSFVVPKDISYSTTNRGKISLYAFDEKIKIDAQGYYDQFVVGGTSDNPEDDKDAPEIRMMFLNDSTFIEGGKVNSTPYFYARLWDKSGVNVMGNSPGHDITFYIDDNPVHNYNLNSYYRNVPDKEGEGEVGFSIPKLKPGLHYAEFKVWDVVNNVRTDTITFEVVEGLKPFIYNLTTTSNPARKSVQFRFSHNRPESKMKVNIMVYDMTGRLQWMSSEEGISDIFKDYIVTWNLENNAGTKLRTGVYLYRAAISTDGSQEATEAKKIIVLY